MTDINHQCPECKAVFSSEEGEPCPYCDSPEPSQLLAYLSDETDAEIGAAMDAMDRTKPLRELIAAIRDRAIEGIVECGTEFQVLNDIVELIDGKAKA